MIDAGAALAGVRAALWAPRWIASPRLGELLAAPRADGQPARDATTATRAARFALRLLSRLRPLGCPWQNNCLYRSVATCLVLRSYGTPAVLKLGARAAAESLSAHAWVEDPGGRVLAEAPLGHTELRPTGR